MLKTPFIQTRPFSVSIATTCLALFFTTASSISFADENDAKQILKAMADYLDAQTAYSFDYDSTLEVATPDDQVIGLASSGSLTLIRPDKLHASRLGGFANVDMNFDGKTLTVFGKNANMYAQKEIVGDTDHLIDELKNVYQVPMPAADLLITNASEILLQGVMDVKDLGSGVIDGVECDSLAFRTEEVDWQIWIAQGDMPYPCRYVITSKLVENGPQYSVQTSNWKTGDAVAARDFTFKNTTNATAIALEKLSDANHLPENFKQNKGASE